MRNVVMAIDALMERFRPKGSFDIVEFDPIELGYADKYRSDIVLKILLDKKSYYGGYKKVLAASFVGWLTLPEDSDYRVILVIQAALNHMKNAAKLADKRRVLTVEQDIVARYLLTGPEFLVSVYDRIGGYDAFENAPSIHDTWAREAQIKAAKTAARAVCYLHHGINLAQERGSQFSPSLNKAVVAFDALKARKDFPFEEHYVGRSLLHKRWSHHKETLALLYAASTIGVRHASLLDVVLSGGFSYQTHHRYLSGWVGRARYVAAYIFARMADTTLRDRTSQLLGDGKSIPFAPAKLMDVEDVIVADHIKKYFN